MAVAPRQGQHLGRYVFCQAMGKTLALCVQHLGYTSHLRGGGSSSPGLQAGHQHMHFATALNSRSDGIEGRCAQRGVVVFSDDE